MTPEQLAEAIREARFRINKCTVMADRDIYQALIEQSQKLERLQPAASDKEMVEAVDLVKWLDITIKFLKRGEWPTHAKARETFIDGLEEIIALIRRSPAPASVDLGLRHALEALLKFCEGLDPEQAVAPQQMQNARIALRRSPVL